MLILYYCDRACGIGTWEVELAAMGRWVDETREVGWWEPLHYFASRAASSVNWDCRQEARGGDREGEEEARFLSWKEGCPANTFMGPRAFRVQGNSKKKWITPFCSVLLSMVWTATVKPPVSDHSSLCSSSKREWLFTIPGIWIWPEADFFADHNYSETNRQDAGESLSAESTSVLEDFPLEIFKTVLSSN